MRGFLCVLICLVAVSAEAQQNVVVPLVLGSPREVTASCPNGQCKPVDAYQESRGPLLGKRVTWQAGTSRGSVRRGPLGLWKTYSYSR